MRLFNLLSKFFGVRGGAPARPCEQKEDDDIDLSNPFPDPITIEITDVLDLHAFAPREVRAVVEEYLREARSRGFRRVRIIHGKGVGVQREAVRRVLARTPFVEHFSDAPPEAGGWGATVATLKGEGEGME